MPPSHSANNAETNVNAAPPILLFGMPRSGTTWIGKIFDSHPETLYRHEPDSWGRLNFLPFMAPLEQAETYASDIRNFFSRLPYMNLTKVVASTPIFPKKYYSPFRYQLFRFTVFAAKALAKISGEQPAPSWIRNRDIPRIRVVWKSIESLGRLGVVERALQPCFGIHITRHPCGYVASVLRGELQQRFTSNVSASEDLELLAMCMNTTAAHEHGLSMELLQSLHPVERLAWRWVLVNAKAIEDIAGEPNCMSLRYEDLCADPIGVAKKLFEFTRLSWNVQTERFVSQSTSKDVGRYYSVVKDPMKAANKWKTELSASDIDRIYAVIAQTHLSELYPRE